MLTDDNPIKLRKVPAPKYKAVASSIPIPTDKTNAVETEGNCLLSSARL